MVATSPIAFHRDPKPVERFLILSEIEEARSTAARRYNRGGSDAEARRVYGFLVRRGYSAEVCAEVAREYREALGGTEE